MSKSGHKKVFMDGLICPFGDCYSNAVRFVEHVPDMENTYRYRCRKCGRTFKYDVSGRHDL